MGISFSWVCRTLMTDWNFRWRRRWEWRPGNRFFLDLKLRGLRKRPVCEKCIFLSVAQLIAHHFKWLPQPVWSMRGVFEGLLGSRSSLPPGFLFYIQMLVLVFTNALSSELGDSRAKQPKRSIKEVFKKRSVWSSRARTPLVWKGNLKDLKFQKTFAKEQVNISSRRLQARRLVMLICEKHFLAHSLSWRSDLSDLDKEGALPNTVIWSKYSE